ncbi:MAG: PD40 domain-containing protein [Anaerolineae bacterium]|nr:PD40 domain-containing protein [Anaerolineae bacterium]
MYKRKNDEPHPMTMPWHRMATIALALGLIVLGVATTGTVLWLITVTPTPYPTRPLVNPKAPVSAPVSSGGTAVMPLLSRDKMRFVISEGDGTIISNPDGRGARSIGVRGQDVAAAPAGQSLAYLRNGQLFVNREGLEQVVNVSGMIMLPTWSADGTILAFVLRESVGDSVYQVSLDSMQPVRLLSVPHITAPPLSNPATGRLLIVEQTSPQQTAFYTIDPQCVTQSACLASRKDIATVPYRVDWADYHPSATALVFSEQDAGNLYLLHTADGKVEPFAADGTYKRRPNFSRDGKSLAYLNQSNTLLVMNLDDKTTQSTSFNGVISMDWLN